MTCQVHKGNSVLYDNLDNDNIMHFYLQYLVGEPTTAENG